MFIDVQVTAFVHARQLGQVISTPPAGSRADDFRNQKLKKSGRTPSPEAEPPPPRSPGLFLADHFHDYSGCGFQREGHDFAWVHDHHLPLQQLRKRLREKPCRDRPKPPPFAGRARRLLFRNLLEDCRRRNKDDCEYFDRHGNHLLSNVLTVGLLGPEELRFRPG